MGGWRGAAIALKGAVPASNCSDPGGEESEVVGSARADVIGDWTGVVCGDIPAGSKGGAARGTRLGSGPIPFIGAFAPRFDPDGMRSMGEEVGSFTEAGPIARGGGAAAVGIIKLADVPLFGIESGTGAGKIDDDDASA